MAIGLGADDPVDPERPDCARVFDDEGLTQEVRIRSVTMRASTSGGPPAPDDTTTVIGRDG